jgi:hypothetical protein
MGTGHKDSEDKVESKANDPGDESTGLSEKKRAIIKELISNIDKCEG